jgi:hypothetical protein
MLALQIQNARWIQDGAIRLASVHLRRQLYTVNSATISRCAPVCQRPRRP